EFRPAHRSAVAEPGPGSAPEGGGRGPLGARAGARQRPCANLDRAGYDLRPAERLNLRSCGAVDFDGRQRPCTAVNSIAQESRMDTKETISVLNDLIETSKDGEKGFRECAEDLKNPQLKTTMVQRAQDCATAVAELQQLVRSLGGDPETSGSVAGDLHRRWVDLKSLVTGKDD